MGNNVYLHIGVCKHCGNSRKVLHIGKFSHGWRFALHVHEEYYDSFESFLTFLKLISDKDELRIENKYITKFNLIKFIRKDKDGKVHGIELKDGPVDLLKGDFS